LAIKKTIHIFAPITPPYSHLSGRKALSQQGLFFCPKLKFFNQKPYLCPLIHKEKEMDRASVYIDGTNFEYGLKQAAEIDNDWNQFHWIDFIKFFELFVPHLDVQKVIYFTAPPINVQKRNRQQLLLKANILLNGSRFQYVNGKYYEKPLLCPLCNSSYTMPEEKRTDVNISVQMMRDCALNNTDVLILVSADSDLMPPLISIKNDFPNKKIIVCFPPNRFSNDLNNFMKLNRFNVIRLEKNKGKFLASIMPDTVSQGAKSYTIPPEWKIVNS
jgi:uncharacterized LabA/DUF88 family protein